MPAIKSSERSSALGFIVARVVGLLMELGCGSGETWYLDCQTAKKRLPTNHVIWKCWSDWLEVANRFVFIPPIAGCYARGSHYLFTIDIDQANVLLGIFDATILSCFW